MEDTTPSGDSAASCAMQGTLLGFADLLVGAGEEYSTGQSEILIGYTGAKIFVLYLAKIGRR
jgi:hypothetical protein